MFRNRSYPPSGLTKEDCDLIVEYLNILYHPIPEYKYSSWESDVVPTADAPMLEMESQSPIICFRSVIILEIPRKINNKFFKTSELSKLLLLSDKVRAYFEKNFNNQYTYLRDSFCYYITDRNKLLELKHEAGKYYALQLAPLSISLKI